MNRFLILIFIAIITVSCSPNINSDDEKPVIENLEIVNLDSVNKINFHTGVTAQFSANFIDNQELGSYKFDIHFAGDGHKHPNDYEETINNNPLEWNFTRNGDLSGTEQKISFNNKVVLKDDDGKILEDEPISGPYHCVVYSVDQAGNSSNFVVGRFIISNDVMPTYTITEPDFTDYKIAAGATMSVQGSVYGRKGLSKLAFIIRSIDNPEADDLLSDSEIIGDNIKEYVFDLQLDIPSDSPVGNYALILLASDSSGNVGELFELFEITN